MARSSSIFARVEPEVKKQAKKALEQLRIPMSNAIIILFFGDCLGTNLFQLFLLVQKVH